MIIPSLQAGGAENVLSILANHWAASGWDVIVLTFEPAGSKPFFHLDPGVDYRCLALAKTSPNSLAGLWNNAQRLRVLRKTLRTAQPDVVISFLTETNVLALLSASLISVQVIVTEHTDPRRCPLARPWAMLRLMTYGWAHRIVVLTEDSKLFFNCKMQSKISVIPNPVMGAPATHPREPQNGREKTVLAVGRIGDEKGFDLLVRAFAQVAGEMPGWRLEIVGEGPRRAHLEGLANDLDIPDRVIFRGLVAEPAEYYRRASVFVLSSRYEGFPMGLCEAMAHGCAVIATEYSSGVFDLIEPGGNGVVVPREDVEALAGALRTLMSSPAMRRELGAAATEIATKYGIGRVMAMWAAIMPAAG